jgi:hypothetical protein
MERYKCLPIHLCLRNWNNWVDKQRKMLSKFAYTSVFKKLE